MAKGIRNLEYIRQRDPRLYEALSDLIQQHQAVAQQVNGNPTGNPHPPAPIDGVTVTGQNGHFHIQIQHRADIYRGIQYYAEFADNPGFSNPHTIHMGDSREHTQFLGNGTYYWRAFASYASSPPSAPAYHGGAGAPQPVSGGGVVGGPALLDPQGSGTGNAGEGLSGPGPVAFRSSTGVPPKRGKSANAPGGSQPGAPLIPSPATGLPGGMGPGSPVGGGSTALSELLIAQAEWLTNVAGTNTITATTAILYQALSAGFLVRLVPVNSNTGAVTLNVNSIGASAVTKNGTTALVGGELQANQAYLLLWDGTRWQIVGWIDRVITGLLQFIGTTNAYPALKRSGSKLQARLADDSNYAELEVFDDAYDPTTWDTNNEVPTKNAVRDKIEALPLVFAPLQALAFNPADSTSYFVGDIFSIAPLGVGGIVGFYLPKATTLYAAGVKFINSVAGTNEASSVYIRVNNTTDYLISASVDNSIGLNVVSAVFGSPVSLNAGDYIEIKWVTPAWVTNPTGVFIIGSAFFK